MQTLFDLYDQWNGLLIIVCGTYATLLAYGYLPKKPKDPVKHELWLKKFGPMMRILAPLIIVTGAVTLGFGLLKDDSIQAKARELNLLAPKMIDPVTRFDNATAGPGQRITLHYTVTSIKSSQITPEVWAKFSRELKQAVFKGADVKRLHRKNIIQVFRYNDANGLFIGELVILPSDPAP